MSLDSVEQFLCLEAYPFIAIRFTHKANLKYANNTDRLKRTILSIHLKKILNLLWLYINIML